LDRTYDGDYRFDLGRSPDGGATVEIEIPYRVAAAAPRV
jgi:hypothetical protein